MLHYPNVLEEVIIAISFLSSKTPFILPPGLEDEARKAHQSFNSEEGDFISYLEIYRHIRSLPANDAREAYCKKKYLDFPSMQEIHHVVEQLSQIVSDFGVPISQGGSTKDDLCWLAAGLLQYYRGDKMILINRDPTPFDQRADYVLSGDIATILAELVDLPMG